MKKTIIIAIIALLGLSEQAKAQLYVGGSIGFHAGFTDDRFTSLAVSPDIGYGLGDWNLGAILNVNAYRNKADDLTLLCIKI